jgi:hypothetical protein
MKHLVCGLMALGLLVGLAGHANAQPTYSFTTFDVPGSSSFATRLNGINSSGQIVGFDGTNNSGFLLDNGRYTTLQVPGATETVAYGINDSTGQIVGYYSDPAGNFHGFLFDQGSYSTLDVPGSKWTYANGINASGQIVGSYTDAADAAYSAHGFLLDQGSYTTLDVPGAIATSAYGINASGQIVGSYLDAGYSPHGFLLDQGKRARLVYGVYRSSLWDQRLGPNRGKLRYRLRDIPRLPARSGELHHARPARRPGHLGQRDK